MKNLLLFLLLTLPCAAQNVPDKPLVQAIDSLFSQQYEENAPGGSIFVQKGDRVLYEKSFGLVDLSTKERFTAKTVANLGSISKTFVAYGILILRNRGKLSLEDSLEKYFGDFSNKEIARKVKIKHLLTHTSGLPDSREVDRDSVFYLTANDEQNFAPSKKTDSLEFAPGSRWKYSNPAYNGLALIIEKTSGMKWQEFIVKNIFKPAGMVDSKITDGAYPSEGVAHAYQMVDGKYVEYDYGEYPTFCASGNGGVWSSINDLRKYCRALKEDLFLDKKTIEFSQTLWHPESWADTLLPRNGFSWFVHEKTEEFPFRIIEHTGSQAGFNAEFLMIPEKDVLVVIEMNSERPVRAAGILQVLKRFGYLGNN